MHKWAQGCGAIPPSASNKRNQIDNVMFDINKLSDLTSRKSNQFSDVEIFEKELAQGVFIAMLRGGFTAANPKLYMDNVVSEYVGQSMYNEFVEIFLDNPWIRVIIFGINNINQWRKFSDNGTTE